MGFMGKPLEFPKSRFWEKGGETHLFLCAARLEWRENNQDLLPWLLPLTLPCLIP